jgi:hypothetical protein
MTELDLTLTSPKRLSARAPASRRHPDHLTAEHIGRRWGRLFHLTEAGAWESIERHGLLSTSALLDRFELSGLARDAIESERRPESVRISHESLGHAWIHDNRPIHVGALRRTLVGMDEREWYRELNRRVFFWLSEHRVDRLLNARHNRHRRHDLVILDTEALLEVHAGEVELAHLNTGAVHHTASYPRGAGTFRPIPDYPWRQRLRTAPREPIVEITVPYQVQDIGRFVIDVRHL